MTDNTWHHVAFCYDATDAAHARAAIWVDGRLEDSAVNDPNTPQTNRVAVFPAEAGTRLTIGGIGDNTYGSWGFFKGLIDDVQIYPQCIGGDNVQLLYGNPGQTLSTIPEPASLALLAVSAPHLVRRRRLA